MSLSCEQFLKDNNIPYKQDVIIPYGLCQNVPVKFHFIIPGAVIHIKSRHFDKKTRFMNQKIIEQTCKQLELMPPDYLLYLFFEDKLDDQTRELFNFDEKVKVIESLSEIKMPIKLPYHISDPGIFRSLGSEKNVDYEKLLKKYIDSKIIMNQKTYDSATVIMDLDEIERANKFNVVIKNETPDRKIIIRKNKKEPSKYTKDFTTFDDYMTTYSVKRSVPLRIIEGISFACTNCGKIVSCGKRCFDCASKIK